jgi:chemotaxis protein methyltransferase CheR
MKNNRSQDGHEADQHLSNSDFKRLTAFLHSQYGIHMPPAKKSLLEGRLHKRMKSIKISSFSHYCDFLFTDKGMEEELACLLDVVTTHKTDFFREPSHFTYLTGKVIPELENRNGGTLSGKFQIWSAACSTGEEPYTMAIVLSEYASRSPGFDFSILATDISKQVLDEAKTAVYSTEKIEPIPMPLRRKYLLRSRDPERRVVRMAPEIREKIAFHKLNLAASSYPVPDGLDAIFCRNVLIYFDVPTQERLIGQFYDHLAPGGHLFMGHAEILNNPKVPLQYVAPTIYRKVDVS